MLEIFIPIEIKWYQNINNISSSFINIIKCNFDDIKIIDFESTFFKWILLKLDYFSKDLIVLCNWKFWENYFVDFDYLKHNFEYKWIKILWENQIWEKISKIMEDFNEVTWILKSDNLLTNSKKQIIENKITNSFFSLSWVIFLLYSLLKETKDNIKELNNIDQDNKQNIEYKWQALLLNETQKTKEIELQAGIDKIEWKIELFIFAIKGLITSH